MPAPLEARDDPDLPDRIREADRRLAALETERAELVLNGPAVDGPTGTARRAAQVHAYVDLLAHRAVLAAQLLGPASGSAALR